MIVPRIGNLLARFAFAVIAFVLALYSAVPAVKSSLTVSCTFSPNVSSTPRATNVTATGNKSFRSIFLLLMVRLHSLVRKSYTIRSFSLVFCLNTY